MKLTYDPEYNIAYISLREKAEEVETIELSDECRVDIAPDGTVYGIELLNANAQLGDSIILDGMNGEQTAVRFPPAA